MKKLLEIHPVVWHIMAKWGIRPLGPQLRQ